MPEPQSAIDKLAHWREAFASQLALADDEQFLRALWSLNALQTGRDHVGRRHFRSIPDGAIMDGIIGKLAIYPWELDTLANELLTSPKHPFYRTFDTRAWKDLSGIVNLLRNIENEEYGLRRSELSMMREMGRIGARQFDWQRGFFNVAALYRSAFIYGQGACADYLTERFGISVEDLTFTGFSLMAMHLEHPTSSISEDYRILDDFGLPMDSFRKVLDRISLSLPDARREALSLRDPSGQLAYRPSVLRRYPCIRMGRRGDRMIAPLPDLISYRLTSGLFFDVAGGSKAVRNSCGKQFETYAHELLMTMLPDATFKREWRYSVGKRNFDASDIVLSGPNGGVHLAIECKARRMDVEARFGENMADAPSLQEMVKGVLQLWRFFAHCRRGSTGCSATAEAKGLVLALDEWFAARGPILDIVIQRAHALADASDQDILPVDRRPVAFCTVGELEAVLVSATTSSLLRAIDLASGEKKYWMLSNIHTEIEGPKTRPKPYPFEAALLRLLPWYQRIKDREKGSENLLDS